MLCISMTWLCSHPFPVGLLLTRARAQLGTMLLRRGQPLLAVFAISKHGTRLSWAEGCAPYTMHLQKVEEKQRVGGLDQHVVSTMVIFLGAHLDLVMFSINLMKEGAI